MNSTKLLALALFTAAYMLGFGAYALLNGNREFIFYGVVMLVLIALVCFMHTRVRLSPFVLWGLSVWGLLHMAGGTVPIPREFLASLVPPDGVGNVLYNFRPVTWFPKYDQLVHAYGFCFASLAAWEGVRAASGGALKPTFGVLVGVVCMGMGLGALNEVVEFIAVLTILDTNVGGYMNTGWDLVSNFVGCLIAAAGIGIAHALKPARLF